MMRSNLGILLFALLALDACGGDSTGPEEGQEWTEIAPLPVPVTKGAAAVLGGKIYVVVDDGHFAFFTPTFRYDPSVDVWEQLPDLPVILHRQTLTVAGGRLVLSGSVGRPGLPSDLILTWNDGAGQWEEYGRLPKPSSGHILGGSPGGLWAFRLLSIAEPSPSFSHGFLPLGSSTWQDVAGVPRSMNMLLTEPGALWGVTWSTYWLYQPQSDSWSGPGFYPESTTMRAAWVTPGRRHVLTWDRRREELRFFTTDTGSETWLRGPDPDPSLDREGALYVSIGNDLYLIGGTQEVGQATRSHRWTVQ